MRAYKLMPAFQESLPCASFLSRRLPLPSSPPLLAFAATQHTTGTIKAYDTKAQTLTLADGTNTCCRRRSRTPA